ncbi:terminase small subunit [Sphingomonas sp. 10B4]|uniref:terminase small subunit n=1 Tax=Sphingomonas sp. 10B4 TaxID=3048575 RepID=UPI002AB3B32C|nr:terminase small subunit [Sphingomonas sp. 10B4]MDY7525369.1 terminase small subunit [Sphingomonas sp. 10B4]MEB0284171.1 terminase small subunit [Sphingomonas sp. 10B4]
MAVKPKARAPKADASKPLTVRQQLFVVEFMRDLNAGQAAIRAGYSTKYANHHACELVALPHVAAAIAEAMEARSKRTKINADWLLTRLAQEVEADIADLYDEAGRVKAVKDWPIIWRTGLVAGLDVESVGGGAGTIVKMKLSDRVKRLELIGKHIDVQAFKERVDHTSSDGSMTPPLPVYNITET